MPKRYSIKKSKHGKASSLSWSWNWKVVAALGVLVLVFGGAMLGQINSAASSGYEIRALEREISSLKDEQERLEFQIASERSVTSVERKVSELGLVPAARVEYVSVGTPGVAKK